MARFTLRAAVVVGCAAVVVGCVVGAVVSSCAKKPLDAASAAAGCQKDTDCKGDRVCVQGQCTAPTATASVASVEAVNDGTDPNAPDLSPDDVNFVDNRKGFGWSDRCFTEIKAAKWGWARAACDRGLALPDVDNARPLLQCYLFHDYDPRLNSNHPGRPRGTDYCCPVNDEDECPPCADED